MPPPRPSSSLSHSTTHTHSSTNSHHAQATAGGSGAQPPPFTPARSGTAGGRISAIRLGGLSAKQVDKITNTIASVKKQHKTKDINNDDNDHIPTTSKNHLPKPSSHNHRPPGARPSSSASVPSDRPSHYLSSSASMATLDEHLARRAQTSVGNLRYGSLDFGRKGRGRVGGVLGEEAIREEGESWEANGGGGGAGEITLGGGIGERSRKGGFGIGKGKAPLHPHPQSHSYLPSSSFSSAPLNPRLPVSSPHRSVSIHNKVSAAAVAGTDSDEEEDGYGGKSILSGLNGADGVGDDSSRTIGRGKKKRKGKSSGRRGFSEESDMMDGEEGLMNGVDEEEEEVDDEEEDEEDEGEAEEDGKRTKESLKGLDLETQEALVVEDLLFVLMGIEGQYIEFHPDYSPDDDFERLMGPRWIIDQGLDPSFSDLLLRILPLATYYGAVEAFVEQHAHLDYGLVNHALCSALRDMLRDYLILVAQLEHEFTSSPTFTLQRLWFYVHPTLRSLELIQDLTSELISIGMGPDGAGDEDDEEEEEEESDDSSDGGIGGEAVKAVLGEMKRAKVTAKATVTGDGAGPSRRLGPVTGGEVLSVISSLLSLHSGDPTAVAIYSTLLLKAAQPYANILLQWVGTGHLEDPYDEFLVKENRGINRGSLDMDYTDEYWERRYTLKDIGAAAPSAAAGAGGRPPSVNGNGAANAAVGGGRASAMTNMLTPRERGLSGGAVVPGFLETRKIKVLLAGKYLNVIRECGFDVGELLGKDDTGSSSAGVSEKKGAKWNWKQKWEDEKKDREELKQEEKEGLVAMNTDKFYKRIDDAYVHANRALLKLLLTDQCLLARLRSLKLYFFMDQGDSFTHFLDLAHHELSKRSKHVSIVKLQSLLDLVVRNPSSASYSDAYKDDIKVELSQTSLTDWLMKVVNVSGTILGDGEKDGIDEALVEGEEKKKDKDDSGKTPITGIEALTLNYTVRFPLSLVISGKTIVRYQLLFRHLLSLKHLEQTLTTTWLEHTKLPVWRKRSKHPELERWKLRIFSLRGRMLSFIQQMYAFCVGEVIEPRWRTLESRLEKVETVDQLLRDHVDFLDTCLKECMLTNAKLLKMYDRIMRTCTLFASYTAHFTKTATQTTAALEAAGGDWTKISIQKHLDFLARFESNFNHHSKIHLDLVKFFASSENLALLALVVRLSNLKLDS